MKILSDVKHIGADQIILDNYFQWPVFFILSKMIMTVYNADIFTTIKIGYFLFDMLLPILITLFFLSYKIELKNIFYILPIYNVLSHYFIVLQFAPQTLAFLYTIILFFIYMKNEDNSLLPAILIVYVSLIFVHPFFSSFFLAIVILEVMQYRKKNLISKGKLLIILLSIYLPSYTYIFSSLNENIKDLINNIGLFESETWTVIGNFLGLGNQFNPQPWEQHPLYNLYSQDTQFLLSTTSRVLLVIFVIFFAVNILLLIKEKRLSSTLKPIDFSIFFSMTLFWLVGLITPFLGQRIFQVIFLPISSSYQNILKRSKSIKMVILILILITPVIFGMTGIGTTILSGSYHIKDFEMEKTGQFIDSFSVNDQNILTATNGYPTGYPLNLKIYYINPGYFEYIQVNNTTSNMDLILYTPKMELLVEYYGLADLTYKNLRNNNIIYNNGNSYSINPLNVIK